MSYEKDDYGNGGEVMMATTVSAQKIDGVYLVARARRHSGNATRTCLACTVLSAGAAILMSTTSATIVSP